MATSELAAADTDSTSNERGLSMKKHAELLAALGQIKGRFLLSGYRSEIYDEAAAAYDWHRRDFDRPPR